MRCEKKADRKVSFRHGSGLADGRKDLRFRIRICRDRSGATKAGTRRYEAASSVRRSATRNERLSALVYDIRTPMREKVLQKRR